MTCTGCNSVLKEDQAVVEVACDAIYCLSCTKVVTVAEKRALDARMP